MRKALGRPAPWTAAVQRGLCASQRPMRPESTKRPRRNALVMDRTLAGDASSTPRTGPYT